MKIPLFASAIFLVVNGFDVGSSFVCPPDYCAGVRCASKPEHCPGNQVSYSTTCGCCTVCVPGLGKGEVCGSPLAPGGPAVPAAECGEGLTCYNNACVNTTELLKKLQQQQNS